MLEVPSFLEMNGQVLQTVSLMNVPWELPFPATRILAHYRGTHLNSPGITPVSMERLDKTVQIIADDLQKIGFFSITGRDDMERFWRGILSRSGLSEGECKYIEKIFNKAVGLAGRNSVKVNN